MHKSLKAELAQNSNEFISHVVDVQKEVSLINTSGTETYKQVEIINVVNDSYEAVNVKGSLNRNRLLISKLLGPSSENQSEMSKSWRLHTLKPTFIPFE